MLGWHWLCWHLIPSNNSDHQPLSVNSSSLCPAQTTLLSIRPSLQGPSGHDVSQALQLYRTNTEFPTCPLLFTLGPNCFFLMNGGITPPLMESCCVTSLSYPYPHPVN